MLFAFFLASSDVWDFFSIIFSEAFFPNPEPYSFDIAVLLFFCAFSFLSVSDTSNFADSWEGNPTLGYDNTTVLTLCNAFANLVLKFFAFFLVSSSNISSLLIASNGESNTEYIYEPFLYIDKFSSKSSSDALRKLFFYSSFNIDNSSFKSFGPSSLPDNFLFNSLLNLNISSNTSLNSDNWPSLFKSSPNVVNNFPEGLSINLFTSLRMALFKISFTKFLDIKASSRVFFCSIGVAL